MSETPPELKPGLPFSLVNKLDGLSQKMIPIDSDRALKMAERITGLKDWGEGGFRARLDAAVPDQAVARARQGRRSTPVPLGPCRRHGKPRLLQSLAYQGADPGRLAKA